METAPSAGALTLESVAPAVEPQLCRPRVAPARRCHRDSHLAAIATLDGQRLPRVAQVWNGEIVAVRGVAAVRARVQRSAVRPSASRAKTLVAGKSWIRKERQVAGDAEELCRCSTAPHLRSTQYVAVSWRWFWVWIAAARPMQRAALCEPRRCTLVHSRTPLQSSASYALIKTSRRPGQTSTAAAHVAGGSSKMGRSLSSQHCVALTAVMQMEALPCLLVRAGWVARLLIKTACSEAWCLLSRALLRMESSWRVALESTRKKDISERDTWTLQHLCCRSCGDLVHAIRV